MLLKAKDKLPLTGKAFHLGFGPSTLFASSFDKCCKILQAIYRHMDSNANAGTDATVASKSSSGIILQDNILAQELNGHLNSREEPCGNITGMFHGCLATGGLISNMLMTLVTHLEILHKIYSEIIMAQKGSVDKDRPILEKIPLLLATFYESAHIMPAGPLLQRCSLKHDLGLKSGVIVPAGAILLVPVQLVQKDDSS